MYGFLNKQRNQAHSPIYANMAKLPRDLKGLQVVLINVLYHQPYTHHKKLIIHLNRFCLYQFSILTNMSMNPRALKYYSKIRIMVIFVVNPLVIHSSPEPWKTNLMICYFWENLFCLWECKAIFICFRST